jgi:hypothetical protein
MRIFDVEVLYDNLGQASPGERLRQEGSPGVGQLFEYAFDDIDNQRTAGRAGAHE